VAGYNHHSENNQARAERFQGVLSLAEIDICTRPKRVLIFNGNTDLHGGYGCA
jgi:hypothetical protein